MRTILTIAVAIVAIAVYAMLVYAGAAFEFGCSCM